MRWRKVTLIGVGLLGGSLGMALRKRKLAGEVHGFVRRQTSIAECTRAGAVDTATTDLKSALENSDLVVFCTPLAQMHELAELAAPEVKKEALVTDVGSVKALLVQRLERVFSAHGAVFVGSHPMAGSERMGVGAARADLFMNAACVVTPGPASPPGKIDEAEELWRAVGGRTLRMSPERHDELVSRSSHLPHVIAAQLAAYVLEAGGTDQGKLCATGFRDTTRIAAGSPEMWRDIVMMNRAQMKIALKEFGSRLAEFQRLLDQNDPARIEEFFEHAKALREAWTSRCASPSPE
jgi:prephenate dehydrogenase